MACQVVPDVQFFPVLQETHPEDTSLSPFMVSSSRGFLPRADPLTKLPLGFEPLETILQRMPVKTLHGAPGLLSEAKLGKTVDEELPDLTDTIEKHRDDMVLMTALYRDYSFLASAYLLEPCALFRRVAFIVIANIV